MNGKKMAAALAAGAAFCIPCASSGATNITACVEQNSGLLRIVSADANCPTAYHKLEWAQVGPEGPRGAQGPEGPQGPVGPAGSIANLMYVTGGMQAGTSVARAFCPPGWKLVGGGALTIDQTGLTQNFPISDTTGLIAWGSNAIGWQAATEGWGGAQAFAVCAM